MITGATGDRGFWGIWKKKMYFWLTENDNKCRIVLTKKEHKAYKTKRVNDRIDLAVKFGG